MARVMEELTREEAIKRHRELWHKIAEIIKRDGTMKYYDCSKIKSEALKQLGYKECEYPRSHCWCCEYCWKNAMCCNRCIIKWDIDCCEDAEYAIFTDAFDRGDNEFAYKYAKIIAELPEREESKND